MISISLNVKGIPNKQTKTSLKNALDKVEGVQAVDIDMHNNSIEVSFNAPADELQIRDCIESSGVGVA